MDFAKAANHANWPVLSVQFCFSTRSEPMILTARIHKAQLNIIRRAIIDMIANSLNMRGEIIRVNTVFNL